MVAAMRWLKAYVKSTSHKQRLVRRRHRLSLSSDKIT
jgi:hypothetical protein